jgi:hypothetical protein
MIDFITEIAAAVMVGLIALAAKTTRFDTRKLFLAALLSLVLYSIVFFMLVELGLQAFQVIM